MTGKQCRLDLFLNIWSGFALFSLSPYSSQKISRPRWLNWMLHPTGDQEVAGSTLTEVGNILSWRLIMKYFLRSFSPFRWFKKGRAGLGGSVGCPIRLETRRSRVKPPPRSATFFHGDWSWNIFYGHSLPSADSRRAIVSFWRKNVHNTG